MIGVVLVTEYCLTPKQCFGECVTMIGRRGLASEGIFLLRSQGWQRSDLLSQGRSASRESSQVQCFALTILTSFVAFDNISYNLPFFVYAFKSRKVMFITCAELGRWWTKGVANSRFRKKPFILIISLTLQKRCHGSPPSTTAPPLVCLTPSVTRSV